ncbi:type II toxin-antitoxin system VapB family antitoxin [bacterium]|nr:type II toxin-antitoxin system VapB family antitoxin [bacterium]
MRTHRVIDDRFMSRALKSGGYRTQKSAVEAGLRHLVQLHQQGRLRRLRGKVGWEGDLEEMRRDSGG